MPTSYTLSEDGRFMHTVATEVVTLAGEIDAWDRVCADPRITQRGVELYDATEVAGIEFDGEDLKALFRHIQQRPELLATKLPYKTAFVSVDVRVNTLGEVWETIADHIDHRLIYFASVERACRWLGVAPPAEHEIS